MRNTKKGNIMQIFYNIPIIGFVIGKATDDFFYKYSSFVLDAIPRSYSDAIDEWVLAHPNEILTKKQVHEIIQNIKD